ncbi:hypothetical protein GDO81_013181 [Engystomops pustulosus]|uniref:Zona-pellucida-binding protein 1/2 N-terminal domain-containing protein n=1 Tax=Engystomops pustulosus TaxID=76066 RepID=A0AAV7B2R1_ENGPU|nr:hypothetical protein GDO81_013181 [Engystomops pustulosus]
MGPKKKGSLPHPTPTQPRAASKGISRYLTTAAETPATTKMAAARQDLPTPAGRSSSGSSKAAGDTSGGPRGIPVLPLSAARSTPSPDAGARPRASPGMAAGQVARPAPERTTLTRKDMAAAERDAAGSVAALRHTTAPPMETATCSMEKEPNGGAMNISGQPALASLAAPAPTPDCELGEDTTTQPQEPAVPAQSMITPGRTIQVVAEVHQSASPVSSLALGDRSQSPHAPLSPRRQLWGNSNQGVSSPPMTTFPGGVKIDVAPPPQATDAGPLEVPQSLSHPFGPLRLSTSPDPQLVFHPPAKQEDPAVSPNFPYFHQPDPLMPWSVVSQPHILHSPSLSPRVFVASQTPERNTSPLAFSPEGPGTSPMPMFVASEAHQSFLFAQALEGLAELSSLKAHLKAIPTKEDMECYVSRLEQSYSAEITVLREEVHQMQARTSAVENTQANMQAQVDNHSATLAAHSFQLQQLTDQLDDAENRGRRNNIRIRGLPETVESSQLHSELRLLFNSVLEVPGDSPVELDRAHRALQPRPAPNEPPRDVICRVHRYQLKESIMFKARAADQILFQETPVQLLPDLSRLTLLKRKALRPFLEVLRQRNIPYTWGFPFRLQVRREGTTYIIRHPKDIPMVAAALGVLAPEIPDWPRLPTPPGPVDRPRPQRPPGGRAEGDRGGHRRRRLTVYVKMLKDSPFLACMDLDIAYKKIIDPTFFWVGPDGRDLRGHSNVNLTETGKLMLKAFNISMSGSYSCNLIYKSIENDVTQEKKMNKYYEFAVLAYLEPDYMYQINARFTALPCSDLANARFALTLLSMIGEVITGLNCHLKNKYHKCHVTKAPKHSLQHELFVAFKVSPFSRGWDKECSISSYYCQKETNIRMEKWFVIQEHIAQTAALGVRFAKTLRSPAMELQTADG